MTRTVMYGRVTRLKVHTDVSADTTVIEGEDGTLPFLSWAFRSSMFARSSFGFALALRY